MYGEICMFVHFYFSFSKIHWITHKFYPSNLMNPISIRLQQFIFNWIEPIILATSIILIVFLFLPENPYGFFFLGQSLHYSGCCTWCLAMRAEYGLHDPDSKKINGLNFQLIFLASHTSRISLLGKTSFWSIWTHQIYF